MSRFTGRRIVVTGAASGIGHAMTRMFLEEGGTVVAADLDPATVPDGALGRAVDVADPHRMAELITHAESAMGGIDILCNNAGVGSTTSVVDATVEEWDRVFAVNARGTFLGMKYALPGMLERGSGVIVNTASVAGMVGFRDRASYCASKGAVIALTKQAAIQYARAGIRVNCVCPGTVDSPWVERLVDGADDPAAYRAQLVARQPMGRLAESDEVARAVLFLASDDAAFVTGSGVVVDGGLVAG
ncbi:SDR family NAD(P)-dependent oxidoreductase [Streptomyces sp. NPDC007818]|uniref:SDR family NAD(P)-dependent oxidoreductase n=1 Tax=Streptomyces sp. NPDC007818 TaxID=3364780 RepID=UPI0036C12D1E